MYSAGGLQLFDGGGGVVTQGIRELSFPGHTYPWRYYHHHNSRNTYCLIDTGTALDVSQAWGLVANLPMLGAPPLS